MEICRELLEQVKRSLSLDTPHPRVGARRSALVSAAALKEIHTVLRKIVVRIKWVTRPTHLKVTKRLRVRSV